MIRQIFLLIIILQFSQQTKAQFNETVRTGRPGQAIGPFAVGKYVFQTQTGFDVGGFNGNQNNISSYHLAPNKVLRFGITRTFEINSAWEYRNDNYKIVNSSFTTNGLSGATIGTRINLYEGKIYIPSVGLQIGFKLPILSQPYNPKYIAPKIMLIASEKVNDKISLLINLGMNYNGNDARPNGVYVANISYSINSKWGTFIENYGSFTSNTFENRWDTGLAYLVNNNLQLDIYGGAGYNNNQVDYFTSIGISWRTLALRNKKLN